MIIQDTVFVVQLLSFMYQPTLNLEANTSTGAISRVMTSLMTYISLLVTYADRTKRFIEPEHKDDSGVT